MTLHGNSHSLLFPIVALTCLGAEDSWSKVRELKSGAELRIFKKGSPQPILAKADDATDDQLIVVVKNEEVAIAKEDIDRVDARPVQSSRKATPRLTKETRESTNEPRTGPVSSAHPIMPDGPTSSSSTSFSMGSKPDFETIYRRAPAPK